MVKNQNKNMQDGLQVRLLGQCETKWSSENFEISRRQPRAILFRLATRLKPVSRSHLCLLLWPDITEAEARRHLSNQIYNLRQALPEQGVLQTSGDHLLLDSQKTWSDVITFERLSQFSGQAELQQAVDLYRGSFLDSFWLADAEEFNLWADKERRYLERRYLECLSKLISIHANQSDTFQAIDYARRYLEYDELAEDIHRRLIDLYATQGDRSAALRQYEHCATVLERELGVEPLPETREVYLAALDDRTLQTKPPYVPSKWTTLPSLKSPIVGREAAMRQLEEALFQVRTKSGSVVLVSGEAGVGKSRLLEEFITEHANTGFVMTGNGYEGQGEIPFLPVLDALRPQLPNIDWHSLDVDPLQLAQLLQLLPELIRHVPNLPETGSLMQEHEESPVFQGLVHLLVSLTQQHSPLVLCLDDLHWTDKTTLSWVGYLGRHLRNVPILLLGGYRVEEAASLESLRAGLSRLNVMEEVQLQGLTERDIGQLIRQLFGKVSGVRRLSHTLRQLTGGNPFFLLETLRTLLDEGAQTRKGWAQNLDRLYASLDNLHWPKSVTETIRQRVERLRPTTIQVLQAGAVIGRDLELDLVMEVSGRSEREVVNALEELMTKQLIADGGDHYQFKHDLIRNIVEDDLSYGRHRLLHRRTGEALERLKPESVATLVRHFTAAGETQKAVNYALQAGDRARGLFAYQEANEFYKQVLAYQRKNGMLEEAARTLVRMGLSYQTAYDFPKAQHAFDESFDLRTQALEFPLAEHPKEQYRLKLILKESSFILDPGIAGSSVILIRKLFSCLLRSGNNWTVHPEIARKWVVSDDGLHYEFHLRNDASWSDGEPVTAHDFVFAWKRLLSQPEWNHFPKMLYMIKGARDFHRNISDDSDSIAVQAVDDLTLVVDLEEPASYFLQLLSNPKLSPLPRHIIETYGEAWIEPDNLVTNGPFLLKHWEPGEEIVLTRNLDYTGHFPGNLMQINFQIQDEWSPDDDLDSYRKDLVDIIPLTAENYHARHHFPDEYHFSNPTKTIFLGFGSAASPIRDVRVRRALGMALDREEFARQMMPGFYIPANGGFLPMGFPGYSSGIGLTFNPKKARKLLDEAGYSQEKRLSQLELLVPEIHMKQGQILQRIWDQNLGIQFGLKVLAWKDFMKQRQQASMYILGWGAYYYSDPDYFLRIGLHAILDWWQHPDYDRLLRKAAFVKDQAERLRLYQKADRTLMEEAVIIPTVYQSEHLLIKPWIRTTMMSYYKASLTEVIIEPH